MPVSAVFENLEAGATVDEISEWFRIPSEQIAEVLTFAALSVAATTTSGSRQVGDLGAASAPDACHL
jgi:hypothetical protein